VDSGLWWIFLLNAYTSYTVDKSLADTPDCQNAMCLILKLWLSEGFDTSPALLCADGCSMIDRRMVSHSDITEICFVRVVDSMSLASLPTCFSLRLVTKLQSRHIFTNAALDQN
jgi:hypothetical protein